MTKEQMTALMERAAEWPEQAQVELVEAMLQIEAKYGGIYQVDEEERAALERSGEDVRLGRFASDDEVAELFLVANPRVEGHLR
jgi:hypothetical protein